MYKATNFLFFLIMLKKNENSKRNQSLYISSINPIKYLHIFIFFLLLNLSYTQIIILKSSSITIKIKGTGEQNIIYGGWSNDICYRLTRGPDEIYINNVKQETVDYKYNFNDEREINTVELIWTNDLTSCHCMFFECDSIIEVDLSKFNSEKVTTLNSMFDSCSSLYYVNFTGFITSKVTSMEYMFYGCAFTSLDLSIFDTSKVYTMECMFSDCEYLTSLNLSNFYTPVISNMNSMFNGCKKLSYINLQNAIIISSTNIDDIILKTSKNLLICLNPETSNYLNTSFASHGCAINDCSYKSLTILESIYNDILTTVECILLKYFIEEKKICLNGTYLAENNECENCYEKCSLCSEESINNNLCIKCNKGYYQKDNYIFNNSFIDCFKYPLEGYYLDNMFFHFKKCYSSCKTCVINGNEFYHNCSECNNDYLYQMNSLNYLNCYKNCSFYYYLNKTNNKYYCTPNLKCPELYGKLILYKRECIDSCLNDTIYRYEYNNECFDKCPENTIKSKYNIYLCEKIDIVETTTYINEKIKTINTDLITEYLIFIIEYENSTLLKSALYINKDIIINTFNTKNIIISENTNKNEIIFEKTNINENTYESSFSLEHIDIINKNQTLLIFDIDNLDLLVKTIKEFLFDTNYNISQIKEGKYFKYQNKEILITLKALEKQKEFIGNETSIDLGNCEFILKEEYNISKNDTLFILKIDYIIKGMKIPKIEYEIYSLLNKSYLIKLNLTKCENEKIKIYNKVSINNNSLDKYNPISDYYNNICSKTTSDNDTDICLKDRRKFFIEKNLTLCEENCKLIKYDYINERAECSCKIKIDIPFINEITFNQEELKKNFMNIKNIANIGFLKCYEIIFKINNIKKNYGCFIFIALLFLYFICLMLFYCKFYDLLKIEIKEVIKIKNNNSKNNNIDKSIKSKNKNFPPIKIKRKTGKIKANKKINSNSRTNKIIKKNKNKSSLISIFNNKSNKNNKKSYKDFELNTLDYETAKIYDNRTYIQYYISLLKENQLIFFSFFTKNDYNSRIIKNFLFFFLFGVHFTINALFFTDATMHNIYKEEGIFNLSYQLPHIIYSSLISAIINSIIKYLSLSHKNVIKLKFIEEPILKEEYSQKIFSILNIKFCSYFILSFILLLFFWYYNTSFCGIYENTQIHLIKDSVISFGLYLIYPFFELLLPGIFRVSALNSRNDKKCLYKFSQLIVLIC